jgi:hypothetical protein
MIRGTYQVPPHIELHNPPLPQEYIDFKEEHEALKPSAQQKKVNLTYYVTPILIGTVFFTSLS